MAGPARKILTLGLGRYSKPHFAAAAGGIEAITAKVAIDTAKLNDAGHTNMSLDANPDDIPGTIAELESTLKSEKWDIVAVGFGVRGFPQNSVLFEQIINKVREVRPNSTLVFPDGPDRLFAAVQRNLPRQ